MTSGTSGAICRHVEERGPVDPARLQDEILSAYRPIVLRGQAAHWPAVTAARQSDETVAAYIARFDSGRPAEVLVGPPEIGGHYFYNEALTGCNFQKRSGALASLLARLLQLRGTPSPDALYAGAAAAGEHLPGWTDANPLGFDLPTAKARIWIGNASHVATHFDEASNIAVVIAGRRRFTLFPPEQFANLYVGPFHLTIAGPPVSMVDLRAPDLVRYPRFAEAQAHAQVAELEPGDAIYIPPIWWHNVQAAGPFNVMMNYWWEEPDATSPLATLIQAIKAMRDLAPAHRGAWKAWFDQYVFDDAAPHAADHLPAHARGVAGRAR